MKKIHQNFYSHTNKKDQDAILLKLCTIMSANRNSKNQHKYKVKKQTTIKYGVIVNKTKIPICNKFFFAYFWDYQAQSGICHEKVLLHWGSWY